MGSVYVLFCPSGKRDARRESFGNSRTFPFVQKWHTALTSFVDHTVLPASPVETIYTSVKVAVHVVRLHITQH